MSENFKLRTDPLVSDPQNDRKIRVDDTPEASEAARIDDAESQMRKALGLLGDAPRHRPESDRLEPSHRGTDRFGGGLHRRRFVQDGEVPVTVLRRDAAHDATVQRALPPVTPAATSRLQRIEVALATEMAAREKAERSLAEAQAIVRDLQTKIGHAELAHTEVSGALRREREVMAQFRQDAAAWEERLNAAVSQAQAAESALQGALEQLQEEQRARRAAEKALRSAEAAQESARHLAKLPTAEPPAAVGLQPQRRVPENASISPAIRRRRAAEPSVTDQEPVKWWLTTKPGGRRR